MSSLKRSAWTVGAPDCFALSPSPIAPPRRFPIGRASNCGLQCPWRLEPLSTSSQVAFDVRQGGCQTQASSGCSACRKSPELAQRYLLRDPKVLSIFRTGLLPRAASDFSRMTDFSCLYTSRHAAKRIAFCLSCFNGPYGRLLTNSPVAGFRSERSKRSGVGFILSRVEPSRG